MLDLEITFHDGETIVTNGWADRPIQQLMGTLHATFEDIREVVILAFTPT